MFPFLPSRRIGLSPIRSGVHSTGTPFYVDSLRGQGNPVDHLKTFRFFLEFSGKCDILMFRERFSECVRNLTIEGACGSFNRSFFISAPICGECSSRRVLRRLPPRTRQSSRLFEPLPFFFLIFLEFSEKCDIVMFRERFSECARFTIEGLRKLHPLFFISAPIYGECSSRRVLRRLPPRTRQSSRSFEPLPFFS